MLIYNETVRHGDANDNAWSARVHHSLRGSSTVRAAKHRVCPILRVATFLIVSRYVEPRPDVSRGGAGPVIRGLTSRKSSPKLRGTVAPYSYVYGGGTAAGSPKNDARNVERYAGQASGYRPIVFALCDSALPRFDVLLPSTYHLSLVARRETCRKTRPRETVSLASDNYPTSVFSSYLFLPFFFTFVSIKM